MTKKKIAHISPHLGGGVGRVLLNYLEKAQSKEEDHALFCFENVSQRAKERCARAGVRLLDGIHHEHAVLAEALSSSDLCVAHWWNHPLLYAWLLSGTIPGCRLLIWSHVTGDRAPQLITPELVAFADIFALGTPVSFASPAIASLPESVLTEKVRLLFSSAGIDHVKDARPQPHDGFTIGYIGTVDYAKMHSRFLQLSLAAGIPDAHFVVAGGPSEAMLREEASALGVSDRFSILGHIEDVSGLLSRLDIFGYPLAQDNGSRGTGEQVLIEAQAAGVPPVVLAGGPEEFVVEHGITGLVASNEEEYSQYLALLAHDTTLRQRLSVRAAARARERFSLESTIQGFSSLFDELLDAPKRMRAWKLPPDVSSPLKAADIFLLSQGEEGERFVSALHMPDGLERIRKLNPLFTNRTRGSIFHYARFFPKDEKLCRWARSAALLLEQDHA